MTGEWVFSATAWMFFDRMDGGGAFCDTQNCCIYNCCICNRLCYGIVTEEPNNETAPVNPAFARAWERGVCKPPSVAIRSLHNVINRYLSVTHPKEVEGLTGNNIDIISYLSRNARREVFPQDVERRFGITRSTSCRVLGLMERKGLIARESVPQDARLKRIVLTDKARNIAEALHSNAIAMENALLQGLSDDDIRRFMHTLDVMQSNLVRTGRIGDADKYSSLAIDESVSRETISHGPDSHGFDSRGPQPRTDGEAEPTEPAQPAELAEPIERRIAEEQEGKEEV